MATISFHKDILNMEKTAGRKRGPGRTGGGGGVGVCGVVGFG